MKSCQAEGKSCHTEANSWYTEAVSASTEIKPSTEIQEPAEIKLSAELSTINYQLSMLLIKIDLIKLLPRFIRTLLDQIAAAMYINVKVLIKL